MDEKLAQDFQRRYLEGERGAMAGLYAECRSLATRLAHAYRFRHSLVLSDEALEDAVAVAVSRVLARFKRPAYRIRSFTRTLSLEIIHILSSRGGPKARFINSVVAMDAVPEQIYMEPEKSNGGRPLVEDLFEEPNGKRIFFDLALNRAFRDACISMAGYVSADRILTESRKLREIHRLIHGKARGASTSDRGSLARDQAADHGDKRNTAQGKQAHDEQGRGQDARAVE